MLGDDFIVSSIDVRSEMARQYCTVHVFCSALIACHAQVISARKGEFETGFERGGQTR